MIQIKNLVKDYGNLRAVNNITFNVNDGEILGFLGPNGAGKSTTLKILTNFLAPTSGEIYIDQLSIYDDSQKIKKLIGYLPENNPLYHEMTAYNYLKLIANLRGILEKDFKQRLKYVVDICGLHEVVAKPIHTMSKGYRQRVGLAQAILHDPEIIILDEPTSGLDPNQILEIRELIKRLGREKTLILSSHILQEVQAVCDRLIIINKGNIVADGTMEQLKSTFQNKTSLKLELIAPIDEVTMIAQDIENLSINNIKQHGSHLEIELQYPSNIDKRSEIYNYIKLKDWVILEMHREYVSLEELFRSLTIEEKGVA